MERTVSQREVPQVKMTRMGGYDEAKQDYVETYRDKQSTQQLKRQGANLGRVRDLDHLLVDWGQRAPQTA